MRISDWRSDVCSADLVAQKTSQMPQAVLGPLGADPAGGKGALPRPVAAWLEDHFPVSATGEAEWSADEIYLPAPRPGGACWVRPDDRRGGKEGVSTGRSWGVLVH